MKENLGIKTKGDCNGISIFFDECKKLNNLELNYSFLSPHTECPWRIGQ
jgi:hypothetical protein